MKIDSRSEVHDYVVLAGKDGNTYVRDYQGSLWKVNVAADGRVTVDTTAGKNGKVYDVNDKKKPSLATTTVNRTKVDITPDNVLTKAHEGSNGYTIEGYANATAFGYSTEASGDNATAFGNDTKATAAGATASGYQTVASGENATAFGENSIAAAKNSLAALGGTVAESATNAAAIGKNAQATLEDSVALGSGAVADRASGAKGYDMLTKGDTTNTSTAWVANANAIAVGNGSTLTRQITGVAAGSQDTDAVNVAQLKAAGFKVTTQNNGDISSSILNGDTLDFEGKDNAIVSTSKDSKTITVAVSKTPTFDSATFYNPTGSNNEKVTIANGQVSAFNGDQKKRAAVGVDNQGNGTLFLVNDDLSQAHLYTQSSKETGNDGITRMYYTSSTDNGGEVNGVHTIAVLDDGINYAGDNVKPNTSEKVVVKHKLNSTMDVTGGADTNNLAGGNIGVVATPAVEDDQGNITQKAKLELKLNKDLTGLNTVTAGSAKIGSAPADTLKLTENGAVTEKTAPAGSYVTGLDNKDWNVDKPKYVSGRAATEDQLKAISDTIKANADAAASQHTEITVNDKANPTSVSTENIGQDGYGNYAGTENDNLLIAAKKDATSNKVTYNIKLNDQLAIGQKGEQGEQGQPGTPGKDGKFTVETSKGTTVVIGHDGEPGKDGKDGISVTGKNGAEGVSITGPNSADGTDGKVGISGTDGKDAVSISGKGGVGHIGLTGPEGEKGKDGISIDITTGLKAPTLDSTKNVSTTVKDASGKETTIEQAPRIQYKNGNTTYEVATMDDGQKYGGDNYVAATDKAAEQNVITKKLNERLDIQGDADKDKLTEQNIGVNVKDGVMKVQLAQNLNLTGNGSVTMGNTLIDNGGVTITTKNGDNTNRISLTEKGLNNGGKTITNVANGTNLNDAVNVSQLNAAKTTVTSSDNSISVTDTSNGTPNHAYDIKVATAILSNGTDGKVSVTNPNNNANSYATGNSVADAINNSGFTLTTSKSEGGSVSGTSTTFIKPGSTVTLNAGKNIALTQADSKVTIALSDDVTAQTITANGKNGNDGEIGLTGKNGADGTVTTIIKTIGKNGTDGKNGTPGVNGTDGITRIVYQDGKDVEAGTTPHTVATLDDGLKFIGDKTDDKAIAKKLGDILKIKGDGTYDAATQTNTSNIQTSVDGDAIKVALNKDINLKQDGSLTVGGNTQDGSKTVDDPIVIKHFDDETLDMITGVDKDGKPISANKKAAAGDYVTGLDNKDWNVDSPTYVSGRATTEDQLKTISDAVKEASTTAGKHTVVTVEGGKDAGTTDYNGENLKLKVTDTNGQKTYDLKLNDNLSLGTVGKDGAKGTDGSVGLKGADGKSGIGLNGKDGISVIGIDGKNGVSITGSNGLNGKDGIDGKIAIGTPGKDGQPGKDAVSISGQNGIGHIGLTGQKGEDGKDGVFTDLSTTLGTATLDPAKNEQSKSADKVDANDKSSRIQYQTTVTDKDGKTKTVITHEVATMDDGQKYAGDFGDGASVKLNKTVNVKGNAKKEADLTDGNIGVVSSQSGDNGQLLIKLNKDLNLGDNGSVKMGNTTINNDGMTISKTESGKTTTVTLTDKGLNNGGNKITNVAAGTDGTDAVNVSQLNDVKTLAGQHTTVEAGSKNITVKEGTNSTGGKNYTIDLAKDVAFGDAAKGDKTVAISGTNGTVMAGTGDNKVTVDGSKGQIVAGGDNGVKIGNIAEGDSRLTIYDKDGKATNQTDKAGKYVTNLGNKTWNKDGSYVSGRAATEDQLHQVESNVNKQIADVNTKIDEVDKHHTEVTVNGGTAAKADGSYTDGNLQLKQTTGEDGQKVYDLKLNDQLKVGQKGDAGKAGKDGNVTVETKGGTTVVIGHDGKDGKDGRDGLFVNGKDGKDGKSGVSITGPNGVAGRDGVNGKVGIAGTDGRDAVSIAGRDGVGHIGLTGPKGADGKDGAFTDLSTILGQATLNSAKNVKGKDGDAKDEKASRIHYETTVTTKDGEKTVSHEVATMDDGMKYSGDSGSAAVKLNNNVQLYGGAKEYAAGDNIGVVVSQDGDNAKMQVKLAKDLKGIDSIDAKTVTTGNTTINNGVLTVKGDDKHKDITVQQGTVNMGGNKIEGVAPGRIAPDSMDAVNGSQLAQRDQAIGKLGGEVNNLDRRVDRVGAGAAALAALHPQDFDPDDKWDFAVGYGNYRGANAAAVGAFYRPNEDTTLSVGGTVDGGENMVNAGISFKFGQGNHVTNSRVAMAKEILALKDYVQKQDEKIEKLEALVGQQGTANAPKRRSILFPDVPENHWAYVYVKKLADRGLLEGYPDGEFKGTRTITRYEFAAIFSRALENGASVDGDMERMSEEFEPEIRELSLNRFRVDRVEGDDNDRHKIERVRVNDRDELVKQKNGEQKKRYRDVYGSVIEKDAPSDAVK